MLLFLSFCTSQASKNDDQAKKRKKRKKVKQQHASSSPTAETGAHGAEGHQGQGAQSAGVQGVGAQGATPFGALGAGVGKGQALGGKGNFNPQWHMGNLGYQAHNAMFPRMPVGKGKGKMWRPRQTQGWQNRYIQLAGFVCRQDWMGAVAHVHTYSPMLVGRLENHLAVYQQLGYDPEFP